MSERQIIFLCCSSFTRLHNYTYIHIYTFTKLHKNQSLLFTMDETLSKHCHIHVCIIKLIKIHICMHCTLKSYNILQIKDCYNCILHCMKRCLCIHKKFVCLKCLCFNILLYCTYCST